MLETVIEWYRMKLKVHEVEREQCRNEKGVFVYMKGKDKVDKVRKRREGEGNKEGVAGKTQT